MAEIRVAVSARELVPSHSAGFDAALDQALAKASDTIGTGEFNVDVQFWAVIEVTNPGQIQQYGVTLTTQG